MSRLLSNILQIQYYIWQILNFKLTEFPLTLVLTLIEENLVNIWSICTQIMFYAIMKDRLCDDYNFCNFSGKMLQCVCVSGQPSAENPVVVLVLCWLVPGWAALAPRSSGAQDVEWREWRVVRRQGCASCSWWRIVGLGQWSNQHYEQWLTSPGQTWR